MRQKLFEEAQQRWVREQLSAQRVPTFFESPGLDHLVKHQFQLVEGHMIKHTS